METIIIITMSIFSTASGKAQFVRSSDRYEPLTYIMKVYLHQFCVVDICEKN